ncbi:MAG: hypothetical protein ACOCUL_03245 [Bacteroidota bacterium]
MRKGLVLYMFILFQWMSLKSFSQDTLVLDEKSSDIYVRGESSLGKWECFFPELEGHLIGVKDSSFFFINELYIRIYAGSVKSPNGLVSILAPFYLRYFSYPYIEYKMNEVVFRENILQPLLVKATGLINIAGEMKGITLSAIGNIQDEQAIFSGHKQLELESFSISRILLPFSLLKLDNQVTIFFKVVFKQ